MKNLSGKILSVMLAGAVALSGAGSGIYSYADSVPVTSSAITSANIMAVENAYDADGAAILQKAADKGSDITTWWKSGRRISDDMNTAVHESFHAISTGGSDYYYYKGTGSDDVTVTKTDVFSSDEIWSSIPASLNEISSGYGKDIGTRGERYIAGTVGDKASMDSIQNGVYGILQEYTAYSWGMNTDVNLINYVESHTSINWYDFEGYLGELANDLEAGAQFTYFTLSYLSYCKSNYPDYYTAIKDNTNFCTVLKSTVERTRTGAYAITNDVLPRLKTFLTRPAARAITTKIG